MCKWFSPSNPRFFKLIICYERYFLKLWDLMEFCILYILRTIQFLQDTYIQLNFGYFMWLSPTCNHNIESLSYTPLVWKKMLSNTFIYQTHHNQTAKTKKWKKKLETASEKWHITYMTTFLLSSLTYVLSLNQKWWTGEIFNVYTWNTHDNYNIKGRRVYGPTRCTLEMVKHRF